MKIKTLLLCSALAFTGISWTQAADVMLTPESESVKYVRACDAYGKGYFYIPGTDTCIRLSGNVRADFSVGDNIDAQTDGELTEGNKTYDAASRLTLVFQSASETELGTLRSYARIHSQWSNGKNGASGQLGSAYIELGGFRIGLDSTIFDSWTGDYGNVINDGIINPTGNTRTNFVAYTFNSDTGFSAIIGAELGNISGDIKNGRYFTENDGKIIEITKDNLPDKQVFPNKQIEGYIPNILLGMKFIQDWGGVSTIASYESYYQKWAGKVRLDYNVTDHFNLWAIGGYKNGSDYYTESTSGVLSLQNTTLYANWGGKWAAWAGATYKVTQKANLNAQFSYSAVKTFATSVNVSYTLLPGLVITPELTYISWNDDRVSRNDAASKNYKYALNGKNAWQAMLRIQRSF
ncbi:porin [Bartonella sp. A05]|uniref:porin n=1 Tax=Bartonella sp. A05 TaxID=2967261 RepID=UPI0022A944FA|nr:porin [Bartonella sp. A05]MCZ2203831.1 porin [Bartonella sp. A05]